MPALPSRPAILIEPMSSGAWSLVLSVSFAHIQDGTRISLTFVEHDITSDGRVRSEQALGTAAGTLRQQKLGGRLFFIPDEPPKPGTVQDPRIAFHFESSEGPSDYVFQLSANRYDVDEGDVWRVLVRADSHNIESPAIPLGRIRRQPELRDESANNVQRVGTSQTPIEVAAIAGGTTYDWHDGHEVTFYNDASENAMGTAGAFHDLVNAIREAQHFVFVVDWSFHPLFCPTRTVAPNRDNSIGMLLAQKAAADANFLVAIHTWNHTDLGAPDAQNDKTLALTALDQLSGHGPQATKPSNLLWRSTSRTGVGWSHHQKFVVLDTPGEGGRRELKVFWGGLDLTKGRFDWPGHHIEPRSAFTAPFRAKWGSSVGVPFTTSDDNGAVLSVGTDDWYSPEFGDDTDMPRQPWHDIHGALKGPAAWDFLREFVGRWSSPTHGMWDDGDRSEKHVTQVWRTFRKVYAERNHFVQQYEKRPTGQWAAQVYRSLTLAQWTPPAFHAADDLDRQLFALLTTRRTTLTEQSIRLAYQHNIDRAERFIYIENQYFMGSSKLWGPMEGERPNIENDIPERIVKRILQRAHDGAPFHVYIVMPMFPEGDPISGGLLEVRHSEWLTMAYMVRALTAGLQGRKWKDYLSFYFLANWNVVRPSDFSRSNVRAERVRAHMRYMVYVHSKLMLVDDRYALFGSCNLNDRGLSGAGDSEIACGIWPSHGEVDAHEQVRSFRRRLWNEHWGKDLAGWQQPQLLSTVQQAAKHADLNYDHFRTMAAPPEGQICRLPLNFKNNTLHLGDRRDYPIPSPDSWLCLPDSPKDAPEWRWSSKGSAFMRKRGWTE